MMLQWTAIFATAFIAARLTLPVVVDWYRNLGYLDHPGERKEQRNPVPFGGGLVTLIGVVAPVVLGLAAVYFEIADALRFRHPLIGHGPGLASKTLEVAAIFTGAVTMLIMGRIDDRRGLSIGVRLALQVAAATLVFAAGPRITAFMPWTAVHLVLTVGWMVFVTNAYNFIDNMDGLLPGSATAAALAIFGIAVLDGQLFVAALALTLAGALAAVWLSNRWPASVYMGDEGSMFTGFLLAALTVVVSYRSEHGEPGPAALAFVIPFLLVGATAADGVVTIAGRLLRGVSPWTAGRDHLSHRLASAGFGERGAVHLLVSGAFASGAVAVCLRELSRDRVLAALPFALVSLAFGVAALRARRAS